MKANRSLITLIGTVALLTFPAAASAEGTICSDPSPLVPDGRIIQGTFPANTDFWYGFTGTPGNSYSLEWGNTGIGSITGYSNALFSLATDEQCNGMITINGTVRITNSIEPQLDELGVRASFQVTAARPVFRLKIHRDALPVWNYYFRLVDTTLFSPGWATFAGLQTFWSFLNTTNATINGTITLLGPTGTQVAALGVGILPGRAVFPSTLTLGVAANLSGTARFTHDGPPGAVLAEAAITNGTYFQRVRFEPVRERP